MGRELLCDADFQKELIEKYEAELAALRGERVAAALPAGKRKWRAAAPPKTTSSQHLLRAPCQPHATPNTDGIHLARWRERNVAAPKIERGSRSWRPPGAPGIPFWVDF